MHDRKKEGTKSHIRDKPPPRGGATAQSIPDTYYIRMCCPKGDNMTCQVCIIIIIFCEAIRPLKTVASTVVQLCDDECGFRKNHFVLLSEDKMSYENHRMGVVPSPSRINPNPLAVRKQYSIVCTSWIVRNKHLLI